MARTNERRERLALRRDQRFFKNGALVARKYGVSCSDHTVTIADRCRDMSDFISAGLALPNSTSKLSERFEEERFYVVGLQALCLGAFHVFADACDATGIHYVV